jgi:hypothetical protein
MAQNVTTLDAGLDGTSQRIQISEAHLSLATCYYGAVDPTSADGIEVGSGFLWWDTGETPAVLKARNATDTDWVELIYHDGTPASALQSLLDAKLGLAGGTLTGPLLLAGNPAVALGTATKQYVDATSRPAPVRWCAMGTASVQVKIVQTLIATTASAVGCRLWADTAPIGADLTVSIVRLRAGSADDSRSASIAAGANAATATFSPALAILAGDRLRLDVTQVGSATAGGNDLLVTITLDPT